MDGGHLRKYYAECTSAWFGSPGEIDFSKLKTTLGAVKMFYYDCLDDIRHATETKGAFEQRLKDQESYFNKISAIPNTHVRLGSIAGAGKKKRQKEVDILLAVEMMNHAFRKNMERAILLSGDRDFKPVVKALVDMGLFIDVAGDKHHTSRDLALAADNFRALSLHYYYEWSNASLQKQQPLDIPHVNDLPHDAVKLEEGKLEGTSVGLYKWKGNNNYYIHAPYYPTGRSTTLHSPQLQRMKLYFDLEVGRVQWASTTPS